MTSFNPENKDRLGFIDILSSAMEITDQADADQYMKAYVDYMKNEIKSNPKLFSKTANAENMCKDNISFYSLGESKEVRLRVLSLFVNTEKKDICKKCNGFALPSKGFGDSYGEPDLVGKRQVFKGSGGLVDCLKCVKCGHSWT